MAEPVAGTTYEYAADVGLAAMHVPDLRSEHAELDLHPGTRVTVVGHDEQRDLVLVQWSDRSGNPRVTSVDPALFAEHFAGV